MSLCTIRFQVTCETKLGQVVYICGNTPQLGNWTPQNAMRLYTDSALYPKWDPYKSILIRQGNKLLFKLCIVDQNHNIRWQSIPHNREIIPTQNLLIEFTAHYQQITLTPIIEQMPKPPRKKTCDILNQLESDGSSSHQYWKQFMSQQEQQSILYITLMTQMRRIIQYGTQQQFINYQQQKLPLINSKQFDHILKQKIQKTTQIIQNTSHLYCIIEKQQLQVGNDIILVDKQKQKDQLISVLGQDSYIVSRQQFIQSYSIHNNQVPIIFHIQNIRIGQQFILLKQLLQIINKKIHAQNKLMTQKHNKLQYYISINIKYQPNKEMIQMLIKKRVSLLIVQQQRILQRLLDLLVSMGKKYYSIMDDLIAVELEFMATMCIKVNVGKEKVDIIKIINNNYTSNSNNSNNSNNSCNSSNNNNSNTTSQQSQSSSTNTTTKQRQLYINSYFTQIKKSILSQSNKSYQHLGKQHFIQSLKDDDIFLGLGYHKKNILLINSQSLQNLSSKLLTQIIALSSKPNCQIIIILNKLNTDIKSKFPSSKTNKLVVIGKNNGLLYANENVLIDLVSNLSLQKVKFCQFITKLVNTITIGLESKTQPTISLIQSQLIFKSTSLGKLGITFIMNKLKQHNQNSSHYKLTLEKHLTNENQYTLKPYILTEQFYLRTIFQNISKQVHDQRTFLLTANFKNDNQYLHKLTNVFDKVFKSKYNVRLRNMQIIPSNQQEYSFIANEEILTKQEIQAQLQFLCEHFLGSSGIKSYNLNMLSPQQKHRRSFADKQLKQRHFQYSHDKL